MVRMLAFPFVCRLLICASGLPLESTQCFSFLHSGRSKTRFKQSRVRVSSALPVVPRCMSLNMQVFSQPFLSSGLFFAVHLKPCLGNSVDCSSKVTRKHTRTTTVRRTRRGSGLFRSRRTGIFRQGARNFRVAAQPGRRPSIADGASPAF